MISCPYRVLTVLPLCLCLTQPYPDPILARSWLVHLCLPVVPSKNTGVLSWWPFSSLFCLNPVLSISTSTKPTPWTSSSLCSDISSMSLHWPSYFKFQEHQLTPIHHVLHSSSPCPVLFFFSIELITFSHIYNLLFLLCLFLLLH